MTWGRSSSSTTSARRSSPPARASTCDDRTRAHRPQHRHLSVRRPDLPPGQPGLRAADPAGRGQLDDRRARHRPLRARRTALRQSGQSMHGNLQAWVALPVENEETDPGFFHHGPKTCRPCRVRRRPVGAADRPSSAYGAAAKVEPTRRCSTSTGRCGQACTGGLPLEHKERAKPSSRVAGSRSARPRVRQWQDDRYSPKAPDPKIAAKEPSAVMLLGGETCSATAYIWWNLVLPLHGPHRAGQGPELEEAEPASPYPARRPGVHPPPRHAHAAAERTAVVN